MTQAARAGAGGLKPFEQGLLEMAQRVVDRLLEPAAATLMEWRDALARQRDMRPLEQTLADAVRRGDAILADFTTILGSALAEGIARGLAAAGPSAQDGANPTEPRPDPAVGDASARSESAAHGQAVPDPVIRAPAASPERVVPAARESTRITVDTVPQPELDPANRTERREPASEESAPLARSPHMTATPAAPDTPSGAAGVARIWQEAGDAATDEASFWDAMRQGVLGMGGALTVLGGATALWAEVSLNRTTNLVFNAFARSGLDQEFRRIYPIRFEGPDPIRPDELCLVRPAVRQPADAGQPVGPAGRAQEFGEVRRR